MVKEANATQIETHKADYPNWKELKKAFEQRASKKKAKKELLDKMETMEVSELEEILETEKS